MHRVHGSLLPQCHDIAPAHKATRRRVCSNPNPPPNHHMATTTFTCFARLPAELRLLIWEDALSVRIALAVSVAPPLAPELALATNEDLGLVLDWIGPAPYPVGLSCNEARHVMEKSYVQLPAHAAAAAAAISASTALPHPHWFDPDKTIVHLGEWPGMGKVLTRLGADAASRLKHVALVFHPRQLSDFSQVCGELKKHCPDMRTLVVEWTIAGDGAEQPRFHPRYPLIPVCTGRELGSGLLDRSLLQIILSTTEQVPAFHMLSGSGWRRELDAASVPGPST